MKRVLSAAVLVLGFSLVFACAAQPPAQAADLVEESADGSAEEGAAE